MSMSIKDFFDRCCLVLACIPLLGVVLFCLFGLKDLLGFCLAPTFYREPHVSSGDGALGVVVEIMVTISIEICLCIYCLIAFRHKIFNIEFYKRNKKWFIGILLVLVMIPIIKNMAKYISEKNAAFVYDTGYCRVQIDEFSDKSILTDTSTIRPKSSAKYILSGDTIFVADLTEGVEVGCPGIKYYYSLTDSLVIEGDHVRALSRDSYYDVIVGLDKK
ncbi:MAG: hypothetical protein J6Y11_05395 [Paludibacteraceae bacterium]|nr:hypothetical protein [Paludibacteraceae bacterium]